MSHAYHALRSQIRFHELRQLPEIVALSALIGGLAGGIAWLAFG